MELNIHIEKWPNGQVKEKYTFYKRADGKERRHGLQEEWHENGRKKREWKWAHSKWDGTFITWRADGTITCIGAHKKRKAHGLFKGWSQKCQLQYEKEFVDGRLERGESFSPTGELVSLVKGGTGRDISYHQNDVQASEIEWKKGREVKATWWYTNGKVESEETWDKDGLLVSGRYFDPNGKKLSEVVDGTGTATSSCLLLKKSEGYLPDWVDPDPYFQYQYRKGKKVSKPHLRGL